VEPMPVAVGDIVIYPEYGGTEVKFDNEEYLLIDCDSLLAIRTSDEKPAAKAKKK